MTLPHSAVAAPKRVADDRTVALTDGLVRAFENLTTDPKAFGHRQHLYVAWCYLRELPLAEAIARYVAQLRRFADFHGAHDKYHATITWAYLVALHDAMAEHPELDFDELLRACPELLDGENGVLAAHYEPEELASARARHHFILPRRRRLS